MIEQPEIEQPKDNAAQHPIKVVEPIDLQLLHTDLAGNAPPAWVGRALKWTLPLALLLFVALVTIPGLLKQWLWMDQVNYVGIFWTVLWIKLGIACIAFLAAFLFIWINLRRAATNSLALLQAGRKSAPAHDKKGITLRGFLIPHHVLSGSTALVTAAIALVFATGFYSQWDTFLRFYSGGSFGLPDPVFGVDLGFYVFRLPWYQLVQGSLLFLAELAICAVVLQYVYFGILRFAGRETMVTNKPAVQHVTGLLFMSCALLAWGYYLDRFNLMYSKMGVVFGIGYTEDHVTIVALWSMIGISIIACALLVLNFLRPNWKALSIGVLTYTGLYVLGVVAIPALVQNFVVKPNELKLETPYLNNFISFTRKAYNLEAIQETSYPALTDLTPDVIARNEDTIQNIRLWDKRPLLQTYQQTQAIRLYYDFYNVDVDRYHLSDGYHQVMLATRELSPTLPAQAQTWVNENLQFTHGFGLVMNFVSKSIGGGFPQYLIDNVPPQS